jgi:23S rRNA pseudouridine1911/1915/1917 synthase
MLTRTFTVSRTDAGKNVLDWLCARLRVGRKEAEGLIRARKVRLSGAPCSNPAWRMRAGQRVEVEVGRNPSPPAPSPKRRGGARRGARPVICYLDEHLVVVDKPAGLTTMRHADEAAEFGARARKFLPTTLADMLPSLIAEETGGKPGPVRAVHRLDKETSGLVVFARTRAAEAHLGRQFRAHTTERKYLAIVRGQAVSQRIESSLVRDRGDGRRGSSPTRGEGQRAVTHVTVLEQLGDFALVECRLETGRTHQVRIHLGEAGTPLCGERVYDRPPHGRPAPDGSGIVALHAATLGLDHPATGQRLIWSAPLPPDMAALLERLRRGLAPRPEEG